MKREEKEQDNLCDTVWETEHRQITPPKHWLPVVKKSKMSNEILCTWPFFSDFLDLREIKELFTCKE